ncbi:biosynthetic peptidoglycan transglycosylase [Faecalibacterium sp. OF04-11AC]|uniref:biosynthetic peptidoglycan transglycosylase n=1 Tax=Faecalibacterium sp. OF04-11AC TaxID=2293109 RepID=UPI001FA849FA|nr:biosynthetic peptidoglycan transglycosylase [Faecalibacterium sp. OF04-11AC]
MKFLFRILRRLVGYLLGVLLVALIAAAATFGWQGYKLYQSAVQATPLETLYQNITARPSFVPYDQLPQTYIDAVLSVEDSRFVHHHGVDPLAIARALWADLRSGTLAEGGSTITQQLAKNVYFTQEKRMARKAAEMFAALDIEKHYSKQEIFEMYVNTIYFGNGCYGVAEAAEGYFKTDAASLTDAQAVVLAGLPQAPRICLQPGAGPQASPGGTAADGGLP